MSVQLTPHRKKKSTIFIEVVDYYKNRYKEISPASLHDALHAMKTPSPTWIHIVGIHEDSVIEEVGRALKLHPLAIEDIMRPGQRPKIDVHDSYIFIVLKMLRYDPQVHHTVSEQVSIVLMKNVLITFCEHQTDLFDPVRALLRIKGNHIREKGCDYLAYTVIDVIVDNYFSILERVGERIEVLENEILQSPTPLSLRNTHAMRKELLFLRKSVWPLRDVSIVLQRTSSTLIKESTIPYFRDIYEHTVQVMDTIETYRDMAGGLVETFLSTMSNRLNEIMKVLTVISTIFIPLTFITGVYGMNFEYMPEIPLRYSYFVIWIVILAVAASMLYSFKKRGWILQQP